VKLVEVPISTVAATVASGRVAVGTLTQPFLKNGLDGGQIKLLGYSATAIAPRFTMTRGSLRAVFAAIEPRTRTRRSCA